MPRYTTRPEVEVVSPKARYSTHKPNAAAKMIRRSVLMYLLLPAIALGSLVAMAILLIIINAIT